VPRELAGVALVVGGAGGLGRAICDQLATEGIDVVVADLPGSSAEVELDVTDPASAQAAVDRVVRERGRLDVLVVASGVGVSGVVEDLPSDAWDRTIAVNVNGTANVVRAAYPTMVAARRGHIAIVSSLSGLVPTPLLVPYSMSKWALVGLAVSLRPEAARHGVGVTVVCPGPIDTGFLDTGGWGDLADITVDTRRYLTSAAGPALSPAQVAIATVKGLRRNRAVVTPGRAGVLWRAARVSPRIAEMAIARAMRAELAANQRR
jgi:NAD(P)-dependent dehydrogenase (short-subunit alcohol dehydrogenase family)